MGRGSQNPMSRGVKILWVGCQNTMDGFDICIGGGQDTMDREVEIPWVGE